MPDGNAPSISPASAGPDQDTQPAGGLMKLLERVGIVGPKREPGRALTLTNGHGQETPGAPVDNAMIERILAFDKKRVDDVAIPRADIIAVDIDSSLDEILARFSEGNHSRMPVYRGDLDDPIGMVHIKDLLGLFAAPEKAEGEPDRPILEDLIRQILYVPPSMPVTDLLLRMQVSRVHMALVIDEFGGTDGLLTIEDLIELIVGDIRDEHDDNEDFSLHADGPGKWSADARIPLSDLSEGLGKDLTLEDHEADTLGGLVFSLAGRVPLRGEIISHPDGSEFEICDADPRRIKRIVIMAGGAADDAADAPPPLSEADPAA